MAKRDYYDVLGLRRGASDQEIKRAYRKLARKCHPDVNPGDKAAEAKFKEISEANEVLGDPEKRRRYDQLGHEVFAAGARGPEAGGGFGGFDFNRVDFGSGGPGDLGDLLSDFFGRRGQPEAPGPGTGEDLHYSLDITFEDAIRGLATEISLQKHSRCGKCGGSGARPGSALEPCPHCGGSGRIRGHRLLRTSQACSRCRGNGKISREACTTCGGRGVIFGTERIAVKIPPGVDNGSRVRLQGMGEPGRNGGPSGDLYIITRVRPHPVLERKGDNLYVEVPITITEAALGAKIEVPTIDGMTSMRIPPETSSGQVFRLRGKGVLHLKGGGQGDQFVTVKIVPPRNLDARSQELLREFARLNPGDPRRGRG
ncbi:MAG: molecular chaperone DnaJ [candidate division NC10 bacterium]|nr:molecular chaperone DnaJ [candidate division NC10 bacterium]MBI4842123.1 molecular chaperone DnaJ [candidate division NC10 bacterium]